ncbi:MAG: autotransporter outer membrane beta-barrel domain-containing protein, partial [Phascolarctobacterium sp.]|nr:autotransporter outer membrane beta-barrel domain-containing protein [Candidatus Phascolarctobacterium caballi]
TEAAEITITEKIDTAKFNVSANATLKAAGETIGSEISNSGTVEVTGGTLGKAVSGGMINFCSDTVTTSADYIYGDINNVKADGRLIINDGTLVKPITNDGVVDIDGVEGISASITGGVLNVNQDLETSADNIKGNINNVTSGNTLTLNGGNLVNKIEGEGGLSIASEMTINADNIVTTGINTVESGAILNLDSGTLMVDFSGGEAGGTINIIGDVAAEGNRIISSDLVFKAGSTFIVDASDAANGAIISGFNSAIVESGAKLFVNGAEAGTTYKILSGNNNIDLQGWTTDNDMGNDFRARYGLKVDTKNTTLLGSGLSEFVIQFVKDQIALSACDIPNIIGNLPASGSMADWVNAISAVYDDNAIQGDIINTVANMGSLANIQHGTWEMNNLLMDEVFDYMNTDSRPMARYDDSVLEKMAYNQNLYKSSDYDVNTIKIGKVKNVHPGRDNKHKRMQSYNKHIRSTNYKYSKDVWASYIHSKEKINGMTAGQLLQNSTLKYDGATVGADLWNSSKGFGGIALGYADGHNSSNHNISSVNNDIDYLGINAYNRTDIGRFSFQYDIGYTKSKNNINVKTSGTEDVTAKVNVHAYSAGLRVEAPVVLNKSTSLIPFAGGRYVRVKTNDYNNNIGLGYKVDEADIFSIPLGVTFRTQHSLAKGWKIGIVVEGGLKFNFGEKNRRQKINYTNVNDGVNVDIADKQHWFAKFGLQVANDNCTLEIGCRHSRSRNIKDRKYFVNLNFKF